MAQSGQQGTGRHPHKNTEEPWPHTKGDQGKGEHQSRSSQASHGGGSERSSHTTRGSESSRSEHRGSRDSDLKEREYRDEKGEVHHHTRTYMEQHKGETNKR